MKKLLLGSLICASVFAGEKCAVKIQGNLELSEKNDVAKILTKKGYKVSTTEANYVYTAKIDTTFDYGNIMGNLYGKTVARVSMKNNNNGMLELNTAKEIKINWPGQSVRVNAMKEVLKQTKAIDTCF